MDAETRRTLAATVLSTLIRVSFVFLALHEYDRENGASAQKTENGKTRETRGRGRDGREGGREKERKRKIVPFLILSINVKKKNYSRWRLKFSLIVTSSHVHHVISARGTKNSSTLK